MLLYKKQKRDDFMAKTVETYEERIERIYKIRNYVLEKIAKNENFSTRSIAKFFTENEFSISNNTVNIYLNSLEKLDKKNYEIIRDYLEKNKPKTVNDKDVQIRVLEATKLLLSDYTVEQIADILSSTKDTIYRDLVKRLPQIETNKEILEKVNSILTKHSLENIQLNKKNK